MSTKGYFCWIVWGSCPSIYPPTVTWARLSGVHIPSICPPKVTSAGLSGVRVPVYFHQRLPLLDCLGFVSPVYVHQRLPLLDYLGFVSQYMSTKGYLGWTIWGSYSQHLVFCTPLLLPTAITSGSSNGVTNKNAVDTVVCTPDDGWWYHPKYVE